MTRRILLPVEDRIEIRKWAVEQLVDAPLTISERLHGAEKIEAWVLRVDDEG